MQLSVISRWAFLHRKAQMPKSFIQKWFWLKANEARKKGESKYRPVAQNPLSRILCLRSDTCWGVPSPNPAFCFHSLKWLKTLPILPSIYGRKDFSFSSLRMISSAGGCFTRLLMGEMSMMLFSRNAAIRIHFIDQIAEQMISLLLRRGGYFSRLLTGGSFSFRSNRTVNRFCLIQNWRWTQQWRLRWKTLFIIGHCEYWCILLWTKGVAFFAIRWGELFSNSHLKQEGEFRYGWSWSKNIFQEMT